VIESLDMATKESPAAYDQVKKFVTEKVQQMYLQNASNYIKQLYLEHILDLFTFESVILEYYIAANFARKNELFHQLRSQFVSSGIEDYKEKPGCNIFATPMIRLYSAVMNVNGAVEKNLLKICTSTDTPNNSKLKSLAHQITSISSDRVSNMSADELNKQLKADLAKYEEKLRQKMKGYRGIIHESASSELKHSEVMVLTSMVTSLQAEIASLEKKLPLTS